MPGVLKGQRATSLRFGRMLRYCTYAAGEILLIFVGITLAIAFENFNDRRRAHDLELGILVSIEQNLIANLAELDRNIRGDTLDLQSLDPVLERMISGLPWDDSLGQPLFESTLWASPYFAESGYENLKQLGLHLVSDTDLRDRMVNLFENTHARLLGDHDAGQRQWEVSVLGPVISRELDFVDSLGDELGGYRVRDYDGALSRGELVAAFAGHRWRLLAARTAKEAAREETSEVLTLLRQYLSEAQ